MTPEWVGCTCIAVCGSSGASGANAAGASSAARRRLHERRRERGWRRRQRGRLDERHVGECRRASAGSAESAHCTPDCDGGITGGISVGNGGGATHIPPEIPSPDPALDTSIDRLGGTAAGDIAARPRPVPRPGGGEARRGLARCERRRCGRSRTTQSRGSRRSASAGCRGGLILRCGRLILRLRGCGSGGSGGDRLRHRAVVAGARDPDRDVDVGRSGLGGCSLGRDGRNCALRALHRRSGRCGRDLRGGVDRGGDRLGDGSVVAGAADADRDVHVRRADLSLRRRHDSAASARYRQDGEERTGRAGVCVRRHSEAERQRRGGDACTCDAASRARWCAPSLRSVQRKYPCRNTSMQPRRNCLHFSLRRRKISTWSSAQIRSRISSTGTCRSSGRSLAGIADAASRFDDLVQVGCRRARRRGAPVRREPRHPVRRVRGADGGR